MATTLFPTVNLCKGSYNKRKHTDISTTSTVDTTQAHNNDNNNDDDDNNKDMTIITSSKTINRYPSRPNDLPNTTQEDETMTRTGIDSAMTYVKAISSADKILLSERLLKLLSSSSSSSSNSSNNNNYSNSSSDRLSNVTVIKPVIPASFDLSYTYSSFYLLGRYYPMHTILYYVLLYM